MTPKLQVCATLALAFPFAARLAAVTPDPTPAFEWATSAGGAKNDKTRAINIDREGNVFLAGEATSEVKFGDVTVKSAGGMDFFIAKLDAKGKFLWAHLGGGSLIDRGYGVATDSSGKGHTLTFAGARAVGNEKWDGALQSFPDVPFEDYSLVFFQRYKRQKHLQRSFAPARRRATLRRNLGRKLSAISRHRPRPACTTNCTPGVSCSTTERRNLLWSCAICSA